MTVLIAAVAAPMVSCTRRPFDAAASPKADAMVIAELATTRPTTKATSTARPAPMPPAVAAARKTLTWVGVSAPIPCKAPIPTEETFE